MSAEESHSVYCLQPFLRRGAHGSAARMSCGKVGYQSRGGTRGAQIGRLLLAGVHSLSAVWRAMGTRDEGAGVGGRLFVFWPGFAVMER